MTDQPVARQHSRDRAKQDSDRKHDYITSAHLGTAVVSTKGGNELVEIQWLPLECSS
jgi:hypothetical protein